MINKLKQGNFNNLVLPLVTVVSVAFFVFPAIVLAVWQGPTALPPGNNPPGFINNSSNQQTDANFNISGTGQANTFTAQVIKANDQICLGSGSGSCKTSWSQVSGFWLTDAVGIHYNGKVGIGTIANNLYSLYVDSPSGVNTTLYVNNSNSGTGLVAGGGTIGGYFFGTSYGIWSNAGSNHFSGSISAGSKTTIGSLRVNGGNGDSIIMVTPGDGLATDSGFLEVNNRARFGYDGAAGAVVVDDDSKSLPIVFKTANTNRLQIAANGKVGINSVIDGYGFYVATTTRVNSLNINGLYTFPTAKPTVNGQVLTGNTNGTMTWAAATTGGFSNNVPKWNSAGTALTATSSLYINANRVGVGTASPAATLDVSGTVNVAGQTISHKTNNAFFIDSNDRLQLRMNADAAGTGNFQINNAANNTVFAITDAGDVGVGTTVPGAKLEVSGQVKITGGAPGVGKVLTSDADGLASWASSVNIGSATANYLTKWTSLNSLGNSVIYNNGNKIGIGTTNPKETVDMDSDGSSVTRLRITDAYANQNPELQLQYGVNTDDHWGMYNNKSDSNSLNFWNPTVSNAVTIEQNGRVGIGVADPTERMDINGALVARGAAQTTINPNVAILDFSGGNGRLIARGPDISTNGGWQFITTRSNNTNVLAPLTISSGGNVGVGTTAPGAKLEVSGQVKITGGAPGAGKVLTSDSNGLASWENSGSGGPGSGTKNYVPKWDAAGTALTATSLIYDNGTDVTMGLAGANVNLASNLAVGGNTTVTGQTVNHSVNNPFYINSNDQLQLRINADAAGTGNFQINNAANNTVFAITNAGNVGIGTIVPGAKLDVAGSAKVNTLTVGTFAVPAANGTAGQFLQYDGTWATPPAGLTGSGTATRLAKWNSNNTLGDSMVYDDGSKVGIGAASPDALTKLYVYGNISGNNRVIVRNDNNTGAAVYRLEVKNSSGTVNGAFLALNGDSAVNSSNVFSVGNVVGPIVFMTGGGAPTNEKMRITFDGRVGINVTSPDAQFQVNPPASTEGVRVQLPASSAWSPFVAVNSAKADLFRVNELGNVTAAGSITSVGDVNIGVNGIIKGTNYLELGNGVSGKEANAGKIAYQRFSPYDALDIIGAGTISGKRKIKLWDNVLIGGNATSSHFAAAELCLNGSCKTAWPSAGPGTGTVNKLSKWSTTSSLGDSQITDNGTSVGIGGTIPATNPKLYVAGTTQFNGDFLLNNTTAGTSKLFFGSNLHQIIAGNDSSDSMLINTTNNFSIAVGDAYNSGFGASAANITLTPGTSGQVIVNQATVNQATIQLKKNVMGYIQDTSCQAAEEGQIKYVRPAGSSGHVFVCIYYSGDVLKPAGLYWRNLTKDIN
ncbi:MAG: hypothetical protein WCX71_03365 [Candidatus Buchananbacteria bacterium]